MPRLPLPATDELKLADWLEVTAILARDKNASGGDLERVLHRSGVLEADDRDATERKVLQVFAELEARLKSAEDAYPFSLEGSLIRLRSRIEDFPSYILCLCISVWRWRNSNATDVLPRRTFEKLSRQAMRTYVGGDSVRFATPRDDFPPQFRRAIDKLCEMIGEGGGFLDQPSLVGKDAKLDIVAWKHFSDRLPGKLIVMGQCASGANWPEKLSELQPSNFWADWMRSPPVSPLIRAFFIPYRVDPSRWEMVNRHAGIVFDRCRLAYWAHREQRFPHKAEVMRWCRSVLRGMAR